MKKRIVTILTGICVMSVVLSGCEASKGLETEEMTISQYKGVEVAEVEKPEEITDEDVDQAIQATLQSNTTTTEITDRPVEEGDTATIDFVGKMDGEEFEGGAGTDYPLVIGSGSFIDGFEDSIIGHNIGDTFDWEGSFPEDYSQADFAGKPVTFTITVKSIGVEEVPKLDKEFVKTVSEKSKTVDEYKAEVKKQLKEDADTNYEETLSASVWQAVLDNTEIKKYPKEETSEIADSLIEQYKSAAEYYQMSYEDFISQNMGSSVEDFEKQVDDAAKSSVKQSMVTEAIAEKEKIKLTDEAYEKQLEEMAAAYGYEDIESLKKAGTEEDLKEIALNNLVKEWLTEHCVQVAEK